jgi:hypothetical protein
MDGFSRARAHALHLLRVSLEPGFHLMIASFTAGFAVVEAVGAESNVFQGIA